MVIRVRKRAEARWAGTVPAGKGHIRTASGALDSDYSLHSREREGAALNTNPEELIGAGLAGCFAMSVANLLEAAGYADVEVTAKAMVQLEQTDAGFRITEITLSLTGSAAALTDDALARIADEAKRTCPISLALAGTTITLAETKVVG
ncbi:OsmC family peroxiredoxin [Streptomyces platensis]|uniref:OsmC family peroxiredoxin n=1 Tax=Streptomyces platensis TaxID=58346 RepID=UPI001F2ED1FE|nr:OsmC family peroxiredoxin [Streptomyces platensis]MCF3142248.1 OsmC family peroxiredoxin [Streptomyces platensis]